MLGSILYTLAVNHKLMCVYYAPAFFGHLLGRCLQRPTLLQKVRCPARLHEPRENDHDYARHYHIAVVMVLHRCTRSRPWVLLSSAPVWCAGCHTSALSRMRCACCAA